MLRTMQPMPKALRDLLSQRDMTETELMAAAGVSPATVNRYLTGSRGRRMNSQAIKTVEKLAAALGVEPEYFLEYRQWKARQLVEQAMREGLIDLNDIELIIKKHQTLKAVRRRTQR